MANKIPLSRVYQSQAIDQRILDVVKTGNYIFGPECKGFAEDLARYIGVKHMVLSSSWTAAVHLLHLAQHLKPGDEILVPSLTAFPSIEPMIHVGAKPIFCDVDDTPGAKSPTAPSASSRCISMAGRPIWMPC